MRRLSHSLHLITLSATTATLLKACLKSGSGFQPDSSRGIHAPFFGRQDAARTGRQDVCPTFSALSQVNPFDS